MIGLRTLKEKDALLMLEWMHDPDCQKGFKKNMLSATIEDVCSFIGNARDDGVIEDGGSLHWAIINEEDEYLGTVSLKDVDFTNRTAEYAITTRRKAWGTGTAYAATGLVLKKAFYELKLNRVYLSVYSNNIAAISLYKRCGFKCEGEFRQHFFIDGQFVNWKWFGMLKDEFEENRFNSGGDM